MFVRQASKKVTVRQINNECHGCELSICWYDASACNLATL